MDYSTRGFDTLDKVERKPSSPGETSRFSARRRWSKSGRVARSVPVVTRLRGPRSETAALFLLLLLALTTIFAPLVSPYRIEEIDSAGRHLAPSPSHPFGTDDLGRDLFLRVMHGGRITLAAGALSIAIALLIGVIAGAVSGYYGGWLDALIMRLTDLVLSIPIFFVVLLFASILSPGLLTICLLVGLTQWMEVARVVRAVVMSIKENEFVEAARALGISDGRILFGHILSHAGGPIMAAATIGLAQAIMMESALSFLGYGVQPPAASWGSMLQNAQTYLGTAPWTVVFPGLMMFLTVVCCYTAGDFLRSAIHTHRRGVC